MTPVAIAAAVAVLGVLGGLVVNSVVKRRAATPGRAAVTWQVVCACVMLLCAAFLVYIVITEASRRYVNIVVIAVLIAGAIWLLRDNQRRDAP